MKAVVFDVDFTLIYPGPMFRGEGYQAFCARYGIAVDPGRFDSAVASAASILDAADGAPYDPAIFVAYTRHIIEQMGGCTSDGASVLDACAREIYDEWAACEHFELYDDVPATLAQLHGAGIRIGLISNSHRCLSSFQSHFELDGLISAAVSSPDHGYLKPHPTIFSAALGQLDVQAGDAAMVGDSVRQDIEGALAAGMRAILLHRSPDETPHAARIRSRGIPVIRSLYELPQQLGIER